MKMNLKGWNKIHSTDDHTIFANKEGHEMRVLHKPLSADMRKEIQAIKLYDGGKVDPKKFANKQEESNAQAISRGANTGESWGDVADSAKQAWGQLTGSSPQQHASGGKIKPAAIKPIIKGRSEMGTPQLVQQAAEQSMAHYADGTGDVSSQDATPMDAPEIDPATAAKRSIYNSLLEPTRNAQPNYVGKSDGPMLMRGPDISGNEGRLGAPDFENVQKSSFGPNGEEPTSFDPHTWEKAQQVYQIQQQQADAQKTAQQQASVATNSARINAGLSPLPSPVAAANAAETSPLPKIGNSAQTPATGNPATPGSTGAPSDPFSDYATSYDKGVQDQMSGIRAEYAGIGAQGKAEAQTAHSQADQSQELMNTYQSSFNTLDSERQNFINDVKKGHINANQYWKDKSTPGKIATGIGLILGGIGGGILGQENPALKMLNMNIDRDIKSQEANLDSSQNLLKANLHQFGNLAQAKEMTRLMLNDVTVNKLKEAVGNSQDAIAKGRGQAAIGALEQQSAQMHQTLAMNRMMMGGMNSQDPDKAMAMANMYRTMGKPEQAKSLEERVVPGVGVAGIPVPQAARDTIIARNTLNTGLNHFYQWASQNSGSLDPKTIAQGKTMAAELQSQYRNSINGGVFKKGEQEFIDNIIDSDPTKFFNSVRVLPKLQEVMRSNNSQLNTLKQGYRLPTQQQQAPQSAEAPQYKTVGGVKYMRGPDGKAIPVK